jgi:hypothetical protein
LENAPAELLREIQDAVARTPGSRLLEQRKPQTTLERFFLEVTGNNPDKR